MRLFTVINYRTQLRLFDNEYDAQEYLDSYKKELEEEGQEPQLRIEEKEVVGFRYASEEGDDVRYITDRELNWKKTLMVRSLHKSMGLIINLPLRNDICGTSREKVLSLENAVIAFGKEVAKLDKEIRDLPKLNGIFPNY